MAGVLLEGGTDGGGIVAVKARDTDTAKAAAPVAEAHQTASAANCPRSHGAVTSPNAVAVHQHTGPSERARHSGGACGGRSSSSSNSSSSSSSRSSVGPDSGKNQNRGRDSFSSTTTTTNINTTTRNTTGDGARSVIVTAALSFTSSTSTSTTATIIPASAGSGQVSSTPERQQQQLLQRNRLVEGDGGDLRNSSKAGAASPRRIRKSNKNGLLTDSSNGVGGGGDGGDGQSSSALAEAAAAVRDTPPAPKKAASSASPSQDSSLNSQRSSGEAASANTPSSSSPSSSPSLQDGGEGASRVVLKPSELLLSLPKVGHHLFLLQEENDVSGASAGSSSSFPSPSPFPFSSLPLVSPDMAEAIKRQQKGASGVRYWKTKHLQSGRNGGNVPAALASKSGAVQSSMFPILKPPSLHLSSGGNGGVVANDGFSVGGPPVGPRLSKAKERLLRQRAGRDNHGVGEFRRSINILGNSNNNSSNNHSNNGQAPSAAYHTHYMYGHALGDYPPPPPAYRRSVTALASILSLPLPPSVIPATSTPTPTSSTHPPPPPLSYKLTQTSATNLNPLQPPPPPPQPITEVTPPPPNPALTLTLTQPPSSQENGAEGEPSTTGDPTTQTDRGGGHAGLQTVPGKELLEEMMLVRHEQRHPYRHPHYQPLQPKPYGSRSEGEVAELTCLQLADAILNAKVADLSHYYQICQTKIRYVDFLERSASFRALETNATNSSSSSNNKHSHAANKGPQYPLLHPTRHHLHPPNNTPRHHTWVPGLDLRDVPEDDPGGGGDLTRHPEGSKPLQEGTRGGVGAGGGAALGFSGGQEGGRSSSGVALPSLLPSSSTSTGLKMSHGLPPPCPAKGFLLSPRLDESAESSASPRVPATAVAAAPPHVPLPPSSAASSSSALAVPSLALPSGKPILKPFDPSRIPVKIPRAFDPFSPRSVFSDLTGVTYSGAGLSVRGKTMYPFLSTGAEGEEEGRWKGRRGHEQSRLAEEEKAAQRSQSSKSRKDAELRKRAVRFSISDQVHEFAPGEPLVP